MDEKERTNFHPVIAGAMSAGDFLNFGMDRLIYIRPGLFQGRPVCFLHAADGTPISVQGTARQAETLARNNDLVPLSVH